MHPVLAGIVLLLHFVCLLMVAGALTLFWTEAAFGWWRVSSFWFRVAHLAAIVVRGSAMQERMGEINASSCDLRLFPVVAEKPRASNSRKMRGVTGGYTC